MTAVRVGQVWKDNDSRSEAWAIAVKGLADHD
jgi:hypothetical protein